MTKPATTPLRRALLLAVTTGAASGSIACAGSAVRAEPVPSPPNALDGAPDVRRRPDAATPSAAACEAHAEALRRRAPAGFHFAIAPPFVVVGDEGAEAVQRWARGTVSWAAARLKALYFDKDPDEILEVWLFKDTASYRKHARLFFGHEPETPYGYYAPDQRALVMNIATGGGTLVHELVHPYVRANFPEAPPWLNEGLGSLYEQSTERGGRIWGLPNWRLPGLKRAIEAGRLPSFEALAAADERAFYGTATSYAQARYLLYYLQEKGLLVDFYKRFFAARRADPTGYATLVRVLGAKDMGAFQKEWEAWVQGLRFPG